MSARVLIAEDEPSIVASLDFLMRQCGFETLSVRDGGAAIACLEEFRPDLVLLDVMLPVKSGFEVCRFIRGNERLAATRVLILTAKGAPSDEARSRGAGADDYLAKPFATRELVARARALLGRRT
ncbi:MAG TPA: response regulator [Usitatibacter sp.]|jgi:DNA-binding response OmpR family regulator|nr:response regulator [Usitatibacter sp.]